MKKTVAKSRNQSTTNVKTTKAVES